MTDIPDRFKRELPGHGGPLALRVWSAAEPSWVALLAHGHNEHSGRYAWVAQKLTDAGASVYAPDHIGHGRSGGERVVLPDAESAVSDLELVRQEIAITQAQLPLVFIGHSLGGMLATRYAQLHQDRVAALVLSAPVLGTWHMLELLEHEVIPETSIDPSMLSRDVQVGAEYRQDPLVWHGAFKRPTLHAVSECLQTISTGPTLSCPALWIHGEEDELVPAEDTRAGIDQIRGEAFYERIYPSARHELFHETNKDTVINDVLTFIERELHP